MVEAKEKGPLWNLFSVKWTFLTRLCGQTPADPNIIQDWLKAREPKVKPAGGKSISEINEEVLAAISRGEGEPDQEYSKLVFAKDDDGNLAMRAATVKAHIKDCARVLSVQYVGRVQGERAFSTRVINGVYPDETKYWIPILDADTGKSRRVPDGEYEKPIHVRGPRGEPQNAIKCFDYVMGVRMEFTLKVLGKSVHETDLHTIFQYGGVHGYAGERSDGEGRYVYEIEKIETGKKAKRDAA